MIGPHSRRYFVFQAILSMHSLLPLVALPTPALLQRESSTPLSVSQAKVVAVATPPAVAVPPCLPPPHLQPEQRLTAGLLPASGPAITLGNAALAQGRGGWTASQQAVPQRLLPGEHGATTSGPPGPSASNAPDLGRDQSSVSPVQPQARHGGVPTIHPGVGGAAPRAAAARHLLQAQGVQSFGPPAAIDSYTPPSLSQVMRPPTVPVHPLPRGSAAAAYQPAARSLPPPSAAWSTSPSAATPSAPQSPPLRPQQRQQTVPPHLQHTAGPARSAAAHPRSVLPDTAPHRAEPQGSIGYPLPGMTPSQSIGVATVARHAAASMQPAGLPRTYSQPTQAALHVPQRSAQQPSAQQGVYQPLPTTLSPAHRSTAPQLTAGLSRIALALAPRPQQQSQVLKLPPQPMTSFAGSQHCEQQHPAAGSAMPPQWQQQRHIGVPSSAGFSQPCVWSDQRQQNIDETGTMPTPLPANHDPPAGLGPAARWPPDAGIRPAIFENGAPAVHHRQVTISHSPCDCLTIFLTFGVGCGPPSPSHVTASLGVVNADEADSHPRRSTVLTY